MENVLKIIDFRGSCDISSLTGEALLKEIVLRSVNSEETEEYHVFLSAVKALVTDKGLAQLILSVRLDKENDSIDFRFKYE